MLVSRAAELVAAGLTLPTRLQQVVAYARLRETRSFPSFWRPVLVEIERYGQFRLREVLRWIDQEEQPLLDAMLVLVGLWPKLLPFRFEDIHVAQPCTTESSETSNLEIESRG